MRLFFWIIVLFNAFSLTAESEICGNIYNTATEPIMGVTVIIQLAG